MKSSQKFAVAGAGLVVLASIPTAVIVAFSVAMFGVAAYNAVSPKTGSTSDGTPEKR
jgi:hypothetical protein